MRKILGYRKFNSKKGTPVCVVSYQEDFSDYDKEHSEELGGSKIIIAMVFGDDGKVFNKDCIGKELQGFVGFSNGSTIIQNPTIK